MITKNWEMTVDFDKDVTYTPARFVAGDHGSCSITLKTIQTITGLRVVISFSMSDGTNYVEEAAVTDSNTAMLSLPSGVLSVAGRVNCQVAVYSTTQRLTHAVGFFYTVSADLADEAIEASDQYPILTQLITDCEKIEDAEVLRVIAEGEADPRSGRVGAEMDREDAEIARVAAEAARAVFEAYDSDKEYVAGNKVSEAGSSYVALINSVGKNPATEPSCWLMIAEKGAQGIQGPQGPQGPQGAQGIPGGDITTAAELAYDNTGSGLVANNTQAAIDEVKALISTNGAVLNKVESISIESILPNNAAAWEFGALSLGDETASTTKIRTVGFIAVTPSTKYILALLNSFLDFQITQYGTAAAGSGADYYITNSAFLATDTEMTVNAACTKIRVVAQPHSGSIEGMTVAAIMAVARFSLLPRTSDKQIKLKVMSHNVGTYSYGIDPKGIPDADVDEKKILWRKMLADNDCDVLGIQEFRPKIDVSNSIDTIATIYNLPYSYTVGDYSYQFMASKYQLKKTARKQLTDGTYRYYSKAYITVDGIEVCIVTTHLQSGDNAPTRALEIAEIIAAVADESHVIIMGDFNIAAAAELDPFTAAGYTLANTGWFGDFLTHPYNAAANLYDNIIVSANIRIDNTYLGDNITSDHFPIIAELSIIKTA